MVEESGVIFLRKYSLPAKKQDSRLFKDSWPARQWQTSCFQSKCNHPHIADSDIQSPYRLNQWSLIFPDCCSLEPARSRGQISGSHFPKHHPSPHQPNSLTRFLSNMSHSDKASPVFQSPRCRKGLRLKSCNKPRPSAASIAGCSNRAGLPLQGCLPCRRIPGL